VTRILIVDDEESIRRSLGGILSDEGFDTASEADGDEAVATIEREGPPDLVLLDIAMPNRDGVEILGELRERWPGLPVVMMSGHGTIETAVRTTRIGAFDFIEKPLSIDKLLLTIQHALDQSRLEHENQRLRRQALHAHEILGETEAIAKLKQQIEVAAPTNGWVLVTGDNGTGKELVARQIHLQSRRSGRPFTGAASQKRGKFELAHGGTIFLDEIADMSLMTQAKVLRVLQESTFERVGGTEPIEVDVRVIAATNKSLEKEIAAGSFREDLYYRLNVIPFHVPSLRERAEDIPVLARSFVEEFCLESGIQPKRITRSAMKRLRSHAWPGNVRELRNLMERLVIMTPGPTVDAEDLPEALGVDVAPERAATLAAARRRFERAYLVAKLREHAWNISRTAEVIGIARESLSRKIKSHKIEVERD
jgi:two-component system nitrogen regulation response regulator NtrX